MHGKHIAERTHGKLTEAFETSKPAPQWPSDVFPSARPRLLNLFKQLTKLPEDAEDGGGLETEDGDDLDTPLQEPPPMNMKAAHSAMVVYNVPNVIMAWEPLLLGCAWV